MSAVCCFLHEVNSLIHFSLITHSLYSFDMLPLSLPSPTLSFLYPLEVFSPLSLFVCLSLSLFSSSLFLQRSEEKDKTGIPNTAPCHAFSFSLHQKHKCAT